MVKTSDWWRTDPVPGPLARNRDRRPPLGIEGAKVPSLFVIQGRDQGKRVSSWRIASSAWAAMRRTGFDCTTRRSRASTPRSGRPRDGYQWVDLSSSNGTFVNHVRVQQQDLRSGDRVQIGRTLMIFTDRPTRDTAAPGPRDVDIVSPAASDASKPSRIVKSISQEEGSRLLAGVESSASPWLARARSNLQVMYRTALAVSHTLDIDQLLHRIMELIFEWVEADRGCIMLVDRETDELVPKVRRTRHGGPAARTNDHQPDDPRLRAAAATRAC